MSAIGGLEARRGESADRKPARRPGPLAYGLTFTIMASATLAAGPTRAGESVGIAGLGLPSEECFDNVAVVLNDRPSAPPRPVRTTKAPGSAYGPDGLPPPDDAHPLLTLFVKQPRPCAAYPDIPTAIPARGLGVVADASDPLGVRAAEVLRPTGAAFPDFDGPAFRSSPAQPAADAPSDAAAGLRLAGGFAVAGLPSRGRAAQSGRGAPPPSFAPGAADGLARSPSEGGPAVDPPLTPPDLTGPPAPSGLVGPPQGVPEPSTWLLFIAGVFGIGASLRRRALHPAV